ncbi:phospholipid-translocating P-type ATPase [Sistotremastrum niveocremeum HHB9708]|uniref:Phospholipid-transporting ATPase n=1 Tax=Sistotremastrum niveocremeum HHB9708 TaxID=1314777 RepID=A0A164N4V1_9AGAM|nr:phospholipid-translocating P-type ATPase [Sistotremastrum niveocremeum HHB9708]
MSFFRRHPPHPDDIDSTDEEDLNNAIDPNLRLRTVRTAASTIAESVRSEQRAERRKKKNRQQTKKGKSFRFNRSLSKSTGSDAAARLTQSTTSTQASGRNSAVRRNVYVNMPLNAEELDSSGQPHARFVRNKVRTSKYTPLTFLPKNLYEQFRRVANLYFLVLVLIQVFPIFGAAAPQVAMVPLVLIITITAIKDGIEDYRRASLDNEVNNSAATKLGDWRNVNTRNNSRTFFQRLFGLNKPGTVSKGVKKLREKEMSEGNRIVLSKMSSFDESQSTIGNSSIAVNRLDDIQSVASHGDPEHVYPPPRQSMTALAIDEVGQRDRGNSFASQAASVRSRASMGVVDWNRHTRGTARWERTLWKKLEVGDIVLLRDNDQVPADIVVLSTSDAEGLCYVETKNLDGETNLKPRKSLRATATISSEEDLEHANFVLDSEPPHANLYLYNGVLRYNNPDGEEKMEPVSINELLLRGCALRNTQWVIGLVVFTGPDTKIMLNGGATPSKRSKIERETNFNVVMNFIVLLFMCIITAVVSGLLEARTGTSADFFEIGAEPTNLPAVNAIVTFASCLIAFQNIVPISLYISIEIVKTIQAYFISQDIDMYYEPYDTNCVPKTWNISDDLGQIEYIFSDKTGTLTQNVMEFQKCSIHGISYGEGVTEAQKGAAARDGVPFEDPAEQTARLTALKEQMLDRMGRAFKNRYLLPEKLTLISPQLAKDLADRNAPQRNHLIAFFRALAICHTVLAERSDEENPYKLEFKAESPDEAALVAAARDVGFPFLSRTNASIDIEVMGQRESYTPLRVLEFNSTRKRMSVIVRNPEGNLILYTKGADSVIYQRLAEDHDPEIKAATTRDMENYANGGLRTLCIAYRPISEEEYMEWSRVYDAAASAIKDRDEALDKANEQIEHSLHILGATALEDKLQEGVPEAIETLHQAGIKLWILTGDKLQTAIEIGYSCNLLKQDMDVMILSADSAEKTRSLIEAGLNKIASVLGPPTLDIRKRGFVPGQNASFAVVIDGDTLRFALDPSLKELFLNLGSQCETVVCCRVSPAQKALTVKLVKEGRNALSLAIGDGANDVAMIQEANIGCGLFGLEGSQAAMSADYAFGQFRFLTKLLLVHGRWSYQRIADMHSNFFYKNVIWTFAMFWYLFYNSFDATYLYEYTFILLYNVVFTSLPVIVLGAFDQDVNAKASLAFPQLYIRGIRGLEYTKLKFWLYMFDGFYQSAVVFFIPYLTWQLGLPVSWNGKAYESHADFGTVVSVAAIFAADIYVGINIRYWTVITWVVVFGSMLVMVIWIAIYSLFNSMDFNDEVVVLYGSITFWVTLLLSVVLAVGPRFIVKYVSSAYYPLDRDIIREAWVAGDLKDQLGISHRDPRKNKTFLTPSDEKIVPGMSSSADLEATAMFQRPHARSTSELSTTYVGNGVDEDSRGAYVVAGTDTPSNGTPRMGRSLNYGNGGMDSGPSSPPSYIVTSPDSPPQHGFVPPPQPSTSTSTSAELIPSSSSNSPALSPVGSYYSASDLPPASPLPPARWSTLGTPTQSQSFSAAMLRNRDRGHNPNMSSVDETPVVLNRSNSTGTAPSAGTSRSRLLNPYGSQNSSRLGRANEVVHEGEYELEDRSGGVGGNRPALESLPTQGSSMSHRTGDTAYATASEGGDSTILGDVLDSMEDEGQDHDPNFRSESRTSYDSGYAGHGVAL